MGLLLHHFGRQVLRSPAHGVAGLFLRTVVVGPAEVRELHAAVAVQEDVLRLDVAVDYRWRVAVQVLDGQKHLAEILRLPRSPGTASAGAGAGRGFRPRSTP